MAIRFPNRQKMKDLRSIPLFVQVFFLSTVLRGSETVKISDLEMPSAARAGTDIKLKCRYELEGETLRSVKWYKGQHEFYRYFPREWKKPQKFFLPPGLTVDRDACDDCTVSLTRIHADMSGFYTCEVTTEEVFESVSMRKFLQVIEPPAVSPKISGVPQEISLNKRIKLSCSLPWMNVKPTLEFFINNWKVKERDEPKLNQLLESTLHNQRRTDLRTYTYIMSELESRRSPSTISFSMKIRREHVNKDNKVEFSCRASAANGTYEEETRVLVGVRRRDLIYVGSVGGVHLHQALQLLLLHLLILLV